GGLARLGGDSSYNGRDRGSRRGHRGPRAVRAQGEPCGCAACPGLLRIRHDDGVAPRSRLTLRFARCLVTTGGFVGALLRLVLLERLWRIDIAERRMVRDQVLRDRDVEALRQHRAECLDLHLPEAGARTAAVSPVTG